MDKKTIATWNNVSKMANKNIKQYNNNTIIRNKTAKSNFNKTKLPAPIIVLNSLGIKPSKINSGGYWTIHCPFHKNGAEKHPSLNLHHISGHFKCHSCDAKGGDILAFFIKITNKSFINAAKTLNAWEV